tara:strand:+ start:53 stop:823 length:771 start_codon:yes stop_codon:yes gene_type:complete
MEELYEIDDTMLEAAVNASKIAKLEAEYIKNRSAAALQQLTKLSKLGKYNMKSLRKKMKQVSESEQIELDEKRKKRKKKKKKKSGGKKDACYHKVKSRYKVWPSAYASGALVKCRKVGAKNWGNKSKKNEGIQLDDHLLQIIKEEFAAVVAEKKKKRKKRKGGKKDGKGASSKGYTLRDWFKGDGWVQTGGKYDGKPCAKQPGQKTKPYCRDPDDRAKLSKKERDKRAAKKRKEDPNPERRGKAKNVSQKKGKKKK